MKAGSLTVTTGRYATDSRTLCNIVADGQVAQDRFETDDEVIIHPDGNDVLVADPTNVVNDPVGRRNDRVLRVRTKIDPAVSGAPLGLRWIEPGDWTDVVLQRIGPPRLGYRGTPGW